jgi:hypothetical protein
LFDINQFKKFHSRQSHGLNQGMNVQNQDKYDEINSFRVLLARRLDWSKARDVEEGITLQSKQGTDAAAAYLKSKEIDLDVALRVLAHPHERRHYTFQ